MINTTTDTIIMEALERLAKALPADAVAIWIERDLNGKVEFTTRANANKYGMENEYGWGATLDSAIDNLLTKVPDNRRNPNPEAIRQEKIRKLQEQIEQLQQEPEGVAQNESA